MSRQTDVLNHWGRAYHAIPYLDIDLPMAVLKNLGAEVQEIFPEILMWPEVLAAEAYLAFLFKSSSALPDAKFAETIHICRDQEFIFFMRDRINKYDSQSCQQSMQQHLAN